MRISRIMMLSLISLILIGCGKKGWFRDRSEDYEKAETCPAIKIPSQYNPESFNDEYNIPKK